MSEIPCGPEHGDDEQADRARPGDEHPIVRVRRPPAVPRAGRSPWARPVRPPWSGGNRGSGSGRRRRRSCTDRTRRGTRAKSAGARLQAHRGAAPSAGPALAAPRGRVPDDAIAGSPAGAARRGGHDARPLVAENGARFGVALQHHVQIGPTDAALGDLDEHLSGSRLRTRAPPRRRSLPSPTYTAAGMRADDTPATLRIPRAGCTRWRGTAV